MAAFSFSSPIFSDEDDRKEKALLTKEEREKIRKDMFGLDKFKETEEMRKQGLIQMEDELLKIAENDKKSYLQALIRCPELVERESSSINFLRSRKYDAKVSQYFMLERSTL